MAAAVIKPSRNDQDKLPLCAAIRWRAAATAHVKGKYRVCVKLLIPDHAQESAIVGVDKLPLCAAIRWRAAATAHVKGKYRVCVKLLIPDHAQESAIVGVEWHITKCAVAIYFSQSSRGLISRFA